MEINALEFTDSSFVKFSSFSFTVPPTLSSSGFCRRQVTRTTSSPSSQAFANQEKKGPAKVPKK